MALWPIFTIPNCIPYVPWDGKNYFYNPYLRTPPRIYQESINSISHFYYEPGQDRICLWATFEICPWPSWAVKRFDFNAETGALLNTASMGIWPVAWVNHGSLGSYGAIYSTWNSGYTVTEMDASAMWPAAGMWSIDPSKWNPSTIFTHAVVNREDALIAGVSSWYLQIWDISGTPTLRGSLRLPYTLGYLCYESREICWIITQNGLVGKINYRETKPRWEMLSSVQNPDPSAKGYYSAFDTRRNRLAVFRWLPDAVDGACQCQIEFYRPLYRIAGLTDPVPVTRLRNGEKARFVAHLYGNSGEGVGTYPLRGTLSEPAAGALLTPITTTEQSGAATFRYQAPDEVATETLNLSASVEE